jgi:AcrR family transcriptional regulator
MVMSVRYRMGMTDDNETTGTRGRARTVRRASGAERLGANDWCMAALAVIGERGVDQVTVEGLARDLGVTKGSFYWHFADRAALLAAALELWERSATTAIIDRLEGIADPSERLLALFAASFADTENGPLDAALVVRADDPVVGPVVRRVTEQRIAFLVGLFRDAGLTPATARRRARQAYSTYVGHFHVRRALPDDRDLDGPSPAYLRDLVVTLAAP